MKNHLLIGFAIAGLLMAGLIQAAMPQPASGTGAPASGATTPGAGQNAYEDQGFSPGFDDLMTMLVQPRHAKLYYAGAARNWELAAAEMRDLRSSFDRLAQAIPNYEGNDVNKAVASFVTPKMDAMDAAVAAADPKRFAGAYRDLTAGCNACHTYMEHPFLTIRVPNANAAAAYPDQDFKPTP